MKKKEKKKIYAVIIQGIIEVEGEATMDEDAIIAEAKKTLIEDNLYSLEFIVENLEDIV